MAADNDLSRTLRGGHEPFYDFTCSVCEGEGRQAEASIYCEECLVYMCDSCVTHHNKFPLNKRHQLLDRSQFSTVHKAAIVSFPTKRCPKHPGELINIFCGDHDVVCCSVCKAFEHSTCFNTKHLPDAAKGVLTSKEHQSIKSETRALIVYLDKVLDSGKANISRIAKEKQHVKQTIADFRKKVNTYFDDLEKKSLDELDLKENAIMGDILQDRKSLALTKTKAEDNLKQLESFKGDNECDLFVHVKTGKQFVYVATKEVKKISETEQNPSIDFRINKEIESYLSSLCNLGVFLDSPENKLQPSYLDTKVNNSRQTSTTSLQQEMSSDQSAIYKTKLLGRFDVKDKSDAEMCSISSICQLPDGKVLIVDCSNGKIKRLDKTYKLTDNVLVPDLVHSVCFAGSSWAALSLYMKQTIQIVSVGRDLGMTASFAVDAFCRGMCYIDGKLFFCCGDVFQPSSSCIKVFNSNGQLQQSIPRAPKVLASVPLYITGCDDGQHLLITSYKSDDITMLDMDGNVINAFSHKNLNGPTGICTDEKGNAFVCGCVSNTVVQLSPKHKKIEVILTEVDGIKEPEGICFDRQNRRLLVGRSHSNDICVFTLQ